MEKNKVPKNRLINIISLCYSQCKPNTLLVRDDSYYVDGPPSHTNKIEVCRPSRTCVHISPTKTSFDVVNLKSITEERSLPGTPKRCSTLYSFDVPSTQKFILTPTLTLGNFCSCCL